MSEQVQEETTEKTEEQHEATKAPAIDPALVEAQEQARKEREERIRAEARYEALQGQRTEPTKKYSRTELQAAVDAGTLSEDQRDQILDKQREEEIRESVLREVRQEIASQNREQTLKQQLAAYRKSHPEAWQTGTPERARLEAAWSHLTNVLNRDPQDPAVEAEALYAAFGPPVRVEEKTRERRETHAEGESGADSKTEGKGSGGRPKDIPSHVLDYYEKRIKDGAYSGWDDPQVKKELAHARRKARARAA